MKNLLHNILITAFWFALACGPVAMGFLFIFDNTSMSQKAGSFSPTGGTTYRLYSSLGSTGATLRLSSFKEPVSNISYTMTYLGSDIEYATIDPNTSISEFVSFSGITQNSDGTATLTGVLRGLSRTLAGGACTASSTLAQSHSGQAVFILSNSPCFQAEYTPLRTNATSSGILVFASTSPPRLDSPAAQGTGTYIATTSEFATVQYVNTISFAGVSNATEAVKGIAEFATQIEMASSTVLGGTGAGLVLQAKYATSSPSVVCGLCAVITGNAGKIAQAFIDLTAAFTWTGLHIFSSGFISSASSTVLSLNVASSTINWNGSYVRPQFGGSGVDGALAISSGTTTINLNSAKYIEKDYTSISITSTGHLAFSNPAAGGSMVVLRSQGNATLTCSPAPCIDVSALGGGGGAGGGSGATSGSGGTGGNGFFLFATSGGAAGSSGGGTPAGGATPTAIAPATWLSATSTTIMRYGGQFWGGGGGGGGGTANASNNATQGAGGSGAGALLMEVGGIWNFTTAGGIYAAGLAGAAPTNTTYGGAGGGGAGGVVKIIINASTANSGTINVTGGAGGAGGSNASASCGAGGGTGFTAGSNGATGSSCTGGAGATGASIIEVNTSFF